MNRLTAFSASIFARRHPAVLVCALAASSACLHASTNNFVVPSFRNAADSEIGYWENFTVAYGAPGNTATMTGSTTGATLTQTLSPSAFVTGSGNLYDPAEATGFVLSDSTPFTLGTVVLQIRTLGAELKYDAIRLTHTDANGTHALEPLSRVELDRGTVLGASVSSLWQWDLTGLGVTDYSINWESDGSSLSLDSVTLDTWNSFSAVPEPSIATMLWLGLGVVWGLGRWGRARG
ncbi:MAG: hypothetical protein AB7O66_05675 [Limisphaerales bacterium]